jgi:hypothetical protein
MATARRRSALDRVLGRCEAAGRRAWFIRWLDTRWRPRAVAMRMRHDVIEGGMVLACAVIGRGSQVLYDVTLEEKGFRVFCDWPRGIT